MPNTALLNTLNHKIRESSGWSRLIPEDQCRIYMEVIDRALAEGLDVALGGAFAVAAFTGFWRNMKDLDIYVEPKNRERMIAILGDLDMKDYYEKLPYDREWIYRGYQDTTLVDVIWAMANHHSQVDRLWLSGPEVNVCGRRVKVIPAEAMVFDKLYIMQRERCDWPDVLNLVYWTAADLDWHTVMKRLGPDWPLLAGLLSVFRWMSPGRARSVPEWLWERLRVPAPEDPVSPEIDPCRVSLLDRRPWYGPDRAKLQPAA